jgi:hypothetical protein
MNYTDLLKKITVAFAVMMMSTTLTLANHTYVSEDTQVDEALFKIADIDLSSEKNIKLLKEKSLESQVKKMERIDKLIAKEKRQASRSNYNTQNSIDKFERTMNRRLKKEARSARRLLNNEERLSRIERRMARKQGSSFHAKAFRDKLIHIADKRVLDQAKERIMEQVYQAGSMEQFYKIFKEQLKEYAQITAENFSKKTGKSLRAPASIQNVDWLIVFGVILITVMHAAVGTLIGSLVGGVMFLFGLPFWPFVLSGLVIGGVGAAGVLFFTGE